MNNLHQEKSLRDHEPHLNRFAVIADRGNRSRGNAFGELPPLPSEVDSEWRPGQGRHPQRQPLWSNTGTANKPLCMLPASPDYGKLDAKVVGTHTKATSVTGVTSNLAATTGIRASFPAVSPPGTAKIALHPDQCLNKDRN
jgi:hypothetical protein